MIVPRGEWLVWICYRGGLTVQQTAYSLGVRISTVAEYRRRLRARLGVSSLIDVEGLRHA